MIKVTNQYYIDAIVRYIGDKYKAVPYLYVNVIKCGLSSVNVETWCDESELGEIKAVYLRYYDCIHFFTKDKNYPIGNLVAFIQNTDPKVIMVPGEIGDMLDNLLINYYSERNHVIDMDKVGVGERNYKSVVACRDDLYEIVDLLMTDPSYVKVYDRNILTAQLFERFDSGFSRYFVVKMDNKIVAACNTKGEVPGFALVGGVIVHPDYRRRGLATDVENYACHVLANEKISKVGFVSYHNEASLELHRKLGAFSIATLAKFVKK